MHVGGFASRPENKLEARISMAALWQEVDRTGSAAAMHALGKAFLSRREVSQAVDWLTRATDGSSEVAVHHVSARRSLSSKRPGA